MKKILGTGMRKRRETAERKKQKRGSVHWPSMRKLFTTHSQGQGPTLKQLASITRTLCCVFNSPVKSINGYPSDWLKLINMAMQDANGHWGRSETPCQTVALQGQNCSNVSCAEPGDRAVVTALPGHSTVLPWHLSPRQVLVSGSRGCIILSWSIFCFSRAHNLQLLSMRNAVTQIPIDIWLNRGSLSEWVWPVIHTIPTSTFEKASLLQPEWGFGEGWEGGEALIFTVFIFNSLEPYGVASSWQKNK